MPQHNGLELIRALQAPDGIPDLRILVVTGFGDSSSAKELRQAGVTLLSKPFLMDDLLAAVLSPQRDPAAASSSAATAPPVESAAPPKRTASPPAPDADVPQNTNPSIEGLDLVFSPECVEQMSALGLTEAQVKKLVEDEFRGHRNYFRYDLENYPLPVRSSFIVYLTCRNLRGPIRKPSRFPAPSLIATCTGTRRWLCSSPNWNAPCSTFTRCSLPLRRLAKRPLRTKRPGT